jgi:hypothetical protein
MTGSRRAELYEGQRVLRVPTWVFASCYRRMIVGDTFLFPSKLEREVEVAGPRQAVSGEPATRLEYRLRVGIPAWGRSVMAAVANARQPGGAKPTHVVQHEAFCAAGEAASIRSVCTVSGVQVVEAECRFTPKTAGTTQCAFSARLVDPEAAGFLKNAAGQMRGTCSETLERLERRIQSVLVLGLLCCNVLLAPGAAGPAAEPAAAARRG